MKRGLYIHIPFCKQKCNYCDFASFAGQERMIDVYLQALGHEAALNKEIACQTLYVGGGTPSLLAVHQMERLAKIICKNFGPIPNFEESTFEANPESLTPAKIAALRNAGFNRISIGLQSFHNDELKTLGRVHTAEQFWQAYQAAIAGGFTNINVDLIAGLPGQTLGKFVNSLKKLLNLGPQHISVYGLQIEEGTPFFTQGLECDQVLMRRMLEETDKLLSIAGYHHYEISNYALPGYEAKHNILYWQNAEYVGLGCAAVSYRGGVRRQNTPVLKDYIFDMENGKTPVSFSEQLTGKAQVGESLMLAFRQLDGVCLSNEQRKLFGPEIERHVQNGLLTCVNKKVKLSAEGLYLANEVFRSFVAPFEDA
ncbi:MAG: radical SAM family heme chaperone HemW [Elusimicrobiaceae bacterium]|nr:radical SAM family heme chaperone HemW [Elusimicrobiaceae bacterium]